MKRIKVNDGMAHCYELCQWSKPAQVIILKINSQLMQLKTYTQWKKRDNATIGSSPSLLFQFKGVC